MAGHQQALFEGYIPLRTVVRNGVKQKPNLIVGSNPPLPSRTTFGNNSCRRFVVYHTLGQTTHNRRQRMITFLSSTDFDEVARCLDDKRLGAQRYEAWSILKWLRNPTDHPKLVKAGYCLMWKGYETALVEYTNAMLIEWARRGKTNELLKPHDPSRRLDRREKDGDAVVKLPPWLGTPRLHSYHRHALVAKLPEHYGKFGWSEDGSLYNGSYLWPVPVSEGGGSETGSNQEGWVLRWPKSCRLPPVPIEPISVVGETERATTVRAPERSRKKPPAKRGAAAAVGNIPSKRRPRRSTRLLRSDAKKRWS